MAFETQGKFLQGLAGDFLVHIESAQRNLNSVPTVTGTANTIKGSVFGLSAANAVIAPGGVMANIVKFAVRGPALDQAGGNTGSVADPYTVIDDFTGAVLNRTVLELAGYSSGEVDSIVAAITEAKWVAEPAETTEQVGGVKEP